jgi:nucleotide-binding universal stress UspA family protein
VFQHILFPTDGSPASQAAAESCVRFAAQVGARMTVLHVLSTPPVFNDEFDITGQVHASMRRARDQHAHECLAAVEQVAGAAGVPCTTLVAEADEPYAAILSTAHDHGCDLVAMASHGRRGVRAVVLGSQTQKLLTHSAIPVLVFRPGHR